MDDSNKPTLFTFGKLKNSHSEESLSDSLVEDPDSGKDISSKINGNHQELVKKMESLNSTDSRPRVLNKPSDDSCTAPHDVPKIRIDNGLNADAAQPRPRYGIYSERRNLFGLDQRLKGNWSFMCDQIENSDGLTEADITWASVNKLHEKEAGVLTLRPKKGFYVEGLTFINCYTPDCRDKKFILKVANLLRKHVYYPYVMYYYSSNENSYARYLHTPNGEFYGKEGKRWVLLDIE